MSKKKRPLRKRIPWGAVVFYLLYFAGIGACCYGIWFGLDWLEGWLADYEAAQPDVKSEQVFAQRFAEPDWQALYGEVGCADTEFESAEHYERYMEDKIAGNTITFYETSNGLSPDHKYVVTAGGEKLATFLLRDMDPAEDQQDWQYASCEIFPEREKSAHICTDQDVTVYINGVALDERYVRKTLHTDAEGYLPEGEHGLRRQWLYVDGLLIDPLITAVNAAGENVELVYDAETNLWQQVFAPMEISEEERNAVIEAAKVYCRYMIGANESGTLSKYFDKEMDNYSTILYGDSWMQDYKSYNFSEAELTSFFRYTDSHFSVRLIMTLNVKRNSGTVKEYPLDFTFFLKKQESGSWLVYRMTNAEVQEQTTLVRLRYMAEDQILADQMVEADAKTLTPPPVEIPQGQVFAGWYLLQTDAQGNSTYSLAFAPGEDGTVPLGQTVLEPMILYALFEKEA